MKVSDYYQNKNKNVDLLKERRTKFLNEIRKITDKFITVNGSKRDKIKPINEIIGDIMKACSANQVSLCLLISNLFQI